MPPDNLSKWDRWAAQLATRYGTDIIYEIWNEPAFVGGTAGYWVGTASQLAQMTRRAHQAIKAIAPAATIVSPAITADTSRIGTFLDSDDGAVGSGKLWIDVLAFHFYNTIETITSENENDGLYDRIRAALDSRGLTSVPIWNTESGPHDFRGTTILELSTAAQRRTYLRKWAAVLMALGVYRLVYYGYDNGYGLKKPAASGATYDMSGDWNEMLSQIVGKTLVSSTIAANGNWKNWEVSLTFSDGSTFVA